MTDHPAAERPAARRRWPAVLGLGLVLLAPGAGRAAPPPAQVQVRTPWFRYLLASIPAGGYLTLENTGATPAVLVGADSPGCGSLMLHRSETAGGTDNMVGVARVTIPAHGQFRFAPGGYHLMCMQPRMRVGQDVPVTLRFADGGRITVRFAVRGADGTPAPDRRKAGGAAPKMQAPKMHM